MRQGHAAVVIKAMCYSIPTYKILEGEELRIGSLSLKFCNRKGNLVQEGVKPIDLLKAVSLFVRDKGYSHAEHIEDMLTGISNLIQIAEEKKDEE